jgi:hypothetical protein
LVCGRPVDELPACDWWFYDLLACASQVCEWQYFVAWHSKCVWPSRILERVACGGL